MVTPGRLSLRIPAVTVTGESTDKARAARGAVRRRAGGMSHADVVRVLENIRSARLPDAAGKDPAEGTRGTVEFGEWERIERLLAGTAEVYDPKTDPVVREERAARAGDMAAREAVESARQEQRAYEYQAHARVYALQVMEEAGLLEEGLGESLGAEGPLVLFEPGDLEAWRHVSERTRHTSVSLQERIPHLIEDPADFPLSVRAHSGLLTTMAWVGSLKGIDPVHVVRLAQADPEAALAWPSG
ncbi:hypothetical protein OOK58_53340 [Streptomyces sp. NBC_01728]|uniref:hypothetical protein n=1 Tax=unclassified Streptomyces TaxID=2593676 RepID=UPI0022543131|nr:MULTISPECIES: hypothetical protein [unclassified Streptomyces]MCX4460797.1 hypothetical protein [Streptomyces sp. NBC_01719]MCX4499873.1 hypothetical protein [Streptomyces sp. NBC_01728]